MGKVFVSKWLTIEGLKNLTKNYSFNNSNN